MSYGEVEAVPAVVVVGGAWGADPVVLGVVRVGCDRLARPVALRSALVTGRAGRDQAAFIGEDDGLDAVSHSELLQDLGHVGLGCRFADY